MQDLNFKVTIDDANLILEGLGQLPFAKVYSLVAKLQQQASQQLDGQEMKAGESAEPPRPPQVQEASDE